MSIAGEARSRSVAAPTRRGLNRVEAAGYVGVSPNTFDKLVSDGRMPKPIAVFARRVWDVRALDLAFDALHGEDAETDNPWDSV